MNFQNWPNHDERAGRLKKCIVPKLDALMFFDYQAMEYRVFGYYCAAQPTIKDFSIVNEFKRGEDPYTNTGRKIFGREPTKEERQRSKRAELSMLYNGSWRTILRQGLAETEDEAKDFVDEIHKARPQISKLTKCVQRIMQDRGYVTTMWGRQLSGRTHNKAGKFIAPERRPMVNQLIQGVSSEIMKDGMLKTDEFLQRGLYDSHLVLTIHDEGGLDCAEAEIPSIVENVPRLFGNERIEKYLPMSVDVAIARPTWADEVPYEGLAVPVGGGTLTGPGSPDGTLPWE